MAGILGLLLPALSLAVTSRRVLREQWIRAKYERKEFLEPKKEVLYSNGNNSMMDFLPLFIYYANVYAFHLNRIKTWEIAFPNSMLEALRQSPVGAAYVVSISL